MPRTKHFEDRSPGSRRKKKQFRRGDTPRDWGPGQRQESHGPEERLQKVLAAMGVGSRRDCEELIREGRVEVDKQVVTVLGTKVDPLKHEIRVDGETLKRPETMYFAVNKPEGVVTTNFDPSGRERVIDLVPTDARLFAVGRLDRSSEGLIILTNDGEFANRLTHPRYGVEKTYLVRVAGEPGQAELNKLRRGVYLSDGVCRVQRIVVKGKHKQSTDMIIVLNEGRNREIRRILARVGHKVLKLRRVGIGRLKLGDLAIGAWRKLSKQEVEGLMHETKQRKGVRRQESGDKEQETLARRVSEGIDPRQPSEVVHEPIPQRDSMPELADMDDDGDIDVDDFAATDEEMVEISGFSEDDSGGALPPGDVLDYEEESDDDEEIESEAFGDSEEGSSAPQDRQLPPRQKPGGKRPGRPSKNFARGRLGAGSSGNRPVGKRPFKKSKFAPGAARQEGTSRRSEETAGEKPDRKFGRRGGRVKFAPKVGDKPAPRGAGKLGRKFSPRTEGQAAGGGGGRGAKFGGGPGKKFRGKPGGKFGGKKGFKPKGKGRP